MLLRKPVRLYEKAREKQGLAGITKVHGLAKGDFTIFSRFTARLNHFLCLKLALVPSLRPLAKKGARKCKPIGDHCILRFVIK